MKYVAYVDALGFKNKLNQISHKDAKALIKSYSLEVYKLWKNFDYAEDSNIHGRIFSDTLIIHTNNSEPADLDKILKYLIELYKQVIVNCGLILRGAISIGEFDDLKAEELKNLTKGLIVGTALVDAYILEATKDIKGSKIIIRDNLKLTIEKKLSKYSTSKLKKLSEDECLYEVKWGDIEFLSKDNYKNLIKFIKLGNESNWKSHYYHTLKTFLIKEKQENKFQIFREILKGIKDYKNIDFFIQNFFKTDGIPYLQKSFLSYLRKKIK